jgi:diguanylate cyclase
MFVAINVIWQRFCQSLLQLFPELNILVQQRKIEAYKKQVKDLEKIVSQMYEEGKQEIEKRSKRLLELHRELVIKEKQIVQLLADVIRDPLTGALNRRGVDRALLRQVSITQRALKGMITPFPHFGVIIIDLDNFKRVNDTFGHDAGDQALVTVVDIARGIFHRDTDIICRSGGDEFLVIIQNTNLDQVMRHAETFRVAIARDKRLRFETFSVTVSVGVAALAITQASRQEDIEAAFHNAKVEADHAAYHSKRNGRNGVVSSATLKVIDGHKN